MLVVLGGLPGTGKSTIAKALAASRSAVYVRVDEIEFVLSHHANLDSDPGAAGYIVAFAIASSNLKLGNLVIADSVNPVPESRRGWRDVAQRAGRHVLEVEVICSDQNEHRRRVETRVSDIVGFELPSWSSVTTREYVPWTGSRLVLDTAVLSASDAVAQIEARMGTMSGSAPDRL